MTTQEKKEFALFSSRRERTLNKLRELQPLPKALVWILTLIGSPIVWVVIFVIGGWYFSSQDGFTTKIALGILVVAVLFLYAASRAIGRDIQVDVRELPPQVTTDRDLQRAVERLTRNNGVIRVVHANVIHDYVEAHYR